MKKFKFYKISKGQHYSAHGFCPYILNRELRFEALLKSSCLYDDPQVPGHINKLFGMSFGDHRKRSARIGWRVNSENGIDYFSYVHSTYLSENYPNAITFEYLGSSKIGRVVEFLILRIGIDGVQVEMAGGNNHLYIFDRLPWLGYRLYPYFGGVMAAPHDMEVGIKIL